MNKKILITALCALAPAAVFSAASNPASKAYVQEVVAESEATSSANINERIAAAAEANFYTVGQLAQGGIVFYVDATNLHGLVVALSNRSNSTAWGPTSHPTFAQVNGLYAGLNDTLLIIASNQAFDNIQPAYAAYDSSNYAASASTGVNCNTTSADDCVAGWYLPSEYEFDLLSTSLFNLAPSGYTALAGTYWTSVENSAHAESDAFNAEVNTDSVCSVTNNSVTKTNTYNARAIRQF